MTTVGETLARSTALLSAAGIDQPRLDARLLLAHALGCSAEHIFAYPEQPLDDAEQDAIRAVVERRLQRQPLARITGHKEFWSLDFAVSADTLVPRPDSETLIEAVLEHYPDLTRRLRILDIGTGSGCLLLALLHARPNDYGLGLDANDGALAAAGSNAARLGLADRASFTHADWHQGLGGDGQTFDIIVCNPPYIPETDDLPPEVAGFDPAMALFAGPDGLDAYRRIIPQLAGLLSPKGGIFFEVGHDQADRVGEMLMQAGFQKPGKRRDLAGIDRCIISRL